MAPSASLEPQGLSCCSRNLSESQCLQRTEVSSTDMILVMIVHGCATHPAHSLCLRLRSRLRLSLMSQALQVAHPLWRPQPLPRLRQLPGRPVMGSVGQRLPRQGRQAWPSKGALGRRMVWGVVMPLVRARRGRQVVVLSRHWELRPDCRPENAHGVACLGAHTGSCRYQRVLGCWSTICHFCIVIVLASYHRCQ